MRPSSRSERVNPRRPDLQAAEPLLEGLLEGAADGHHLADRLHLGAEQRARAAELLEGPARDLDDDVVEDRLEATPA